MQRDRAELRRRALEPGSIAERAQLVAQDLRRRMRRMTGRFAAHRDLFLDAEGEISPAARNFLRMLGKACFAHESTFDPDPRIHARNEGMREVYLDIVSGLELDGAKLAALTRQLREAENE